MQIACKTSSVWKPPRRILKEDTDDVRNPTFQKQIMLGKQLKKYLMQQNDITITDMVNISKRQLPYRDWVINAWRRNPHPTGKTIAGPKTHYTLVQRKCTHIYSSNMIVNWKWKRNYSYRDQKSPTWDRHKKYSGVKVLWCDSNLPIFKYGYKLHNCTNKGLLGINWHARYRPVCNTMSQPHRMWYEFQFPISLKLIIEKIIAIALYWIL